MLANNPHQIIRQVLELELSHTDRAFELQEAVARLFQGQGRSVMESVFDQIVGTEELVRVERLEIDLGMLQGSDWMTQFSQRLATQLQSNLEQILHSSAAQTTPDSSIYGSKQDGWFQQFLFFCEHGRLPWWGRKPSDDWLETLQAAMTPAQWRTLAQLLSQDARALRRLIYTVSDEFLQTMLQILNDLPESATVLRLLVPRDLPHPVQALWRERFWLTVLPYCTSPTAVSVDGPKLMQHLWTERQTLLQPNSTHTPETGLSPTGSENIDATESRSHPPSHLSSHETLQSGNITAIDLRSPLPQPWQTWLEQSLPSPVTHIPTVMPLADVGAEAYAQLLYFCQHGSLPGQRHEPSGQWLETLQSTMTLAQWRSLAQLLSQDARALRRLIYTVSDEFLQTMLQILNDLPESATVLRLLVPRDLPHPVQALWRERFWLTVLPYCTSPTAVSVDGPKLMQHLWTERQTLLQPNSTHTPETEISPTDSDNREATDQRSHLPTYLPSHKTPQSGNTTAIDLRSPFPEPWQSWLEHLLASLIIDIPRVMPLTDVAAAVDAQQTNQSLPVFPGTEAKQAITGAEEPTVDSAIHPPMPSVARSASPRQPSISQTPQRPSAIETSESKAVYIGGTGIVIVHPFLQELFQSLELLADNQFRDQQTQRRAVALLTYLTYGEADIPEYELLLPKLLCVWPWEEPLPPYELDEAERNTCEELLGAVLKHWSALRSSSTEWLRQQFFWRDGKLKPVDLGWQLTIEHRMQDVLLSKLPWGIGVIHLPWMTDFLHVNWMQ